MVIKINEPAWFSAQLYDVKEALVDPGGGSEGPNPSVRPDACLTETDILHRQDRISLFGWLIFLMKRELY